MIRSLALLLLVLLCGCHDQQGNREVWSPYLRLAEQDDVPTLDPARGYDVASWQFEDMLFNTLVDYDQEGALAPEAALSWEISADARQYVFHLRPDMHFTNGRRLEASDFEYAIKRVISPAAKSPGAEFFRGIAGAEQCVATSCDVEGIKVRDALTLEIELRAVDPLFLHKLAMPFAAAVPREAVAQWGEDFSHHPVGSGPFMLDEWKIGQYLLLRRNPSYFVSGVPRLEGVQRLVGVNDELAWFKYESGMLDIAEIPPAEFPRVIHDPKFEGLLRRVVTMRTQYIGMNCLQAPFNDRRVRRALNHAINRGKLLQLINQRGVIATGVLPPQMPGYNAAAPGYSFDPARARELLSEAGFGAGLSSTLWVRLDELTLRLAQSIQQDLADVGIAVSIKALAWGPFLDAVKRTDLVPLFLLGWEADFPDPSNFLEVLFHSKYIGTNNNANYNNPAVDALLDEAARTIDQAARLQFLQKAETLIMDDAPWAPLYYPATYQALSPRVRDYQLHPLRPARLERTWLDAAQTTVDGR